MSFGLQFQDLVIVVVHLLAALELRAILQILPVPAVGENSSGKFTGIRCPRSYVVSKKDPR
jgi:hypothetical protein